ncbi:MAG TPA: R3H domain-containing nucleic acid-binding protein [Solirubrobacteraceae bacterium]|nr:R3H domain-containing nucleic acid-binding protein [Solirubrobacteraceae bacterium]
MATSPDSAAERVRELMERILDAGDIEATIEVREDAAGLHAEFVGDGDDLGLLIGHHGQTIDAIQHLAYRIASHGEDDRVSVLVDAAGYRERRATALRATADQAAQQAIGGRRAVSLDAMSALERKVIHEHLKDRHDVETYSEGQEPSRYLVVAPLVD